MRLTERSDGRWLPARGATEEEWAQSPEAMLVDPAPPLHPLDTLVAGLTERERFILHVLFESNRSLAWAGSQLGITKQRVQQVRDRALAKLRRAVKVALNQQDGGRA